MRTWRWTDRRRTPGQPPHEGSHGGSTSDGHIPPQVPSAWRPQGGGKTVLDVEVDVVVVAQPPASQLLGTAPTQAPAAVRRDAARGRALERARGLAGAWRPAARDIAGLAAGRFGGAALDDPDAALVRERGRRLV